ncbi:MAG: TonB-dependent receptor, partial [Calditrichaeota bacterium]|nr:TonB-dependent receptor [Calditrichota bacterium]
RRYDIERLRQSVSASFDYKLADAHTLFLRGIFSDRKDWETRYRLRYNGIEYVGAGIFETEIRRETKGGIGNSEVDNRRLEHQKTRNASLSGEHYFGSINVNWIASAGYAEEARPNERYITWRQKGVATRLNLSNSRQPKAIFVNPSLENDPTQYDLKEITEENQFTREKDLNGKLDVTIPFSSNSQSIKFGIRTRYKDKIRDNDFAEYEPIAGFDDMTTSKIKDVTVDGFNAGDYKSGIFSTPEFLGSLNLANSAQFDNQLVYDEFAPANYTAEEKIFFFFVMYNNALTADWFLSLGLRYEGTDINYVGNRFDGDETILKVKGSKDYTNIMPSVFLKYKLDPQSNIKASFTNTLARPNYYDLVPYIAENKDDEEVAIGNPDLEATTSVNIDLMYEKFLPNVGLISAGFFYKSINDFIFIYESKGSYTFIGDATPTANVQFARPLNGSDASLFGFEIAGQTQLGFINNTLRNFSIYGNYTFTSSTIDGLPIEGRENEDLSLPGTAEHTINASLAYEESDFSVRLSMNYSSAFIEAGGIGSNAFYDQYYDEAFRLDVNGSYNFTPQLSIFAEANNLTDQPLRYYQGIQSRTMQAEYYDVKFNFGLKYDF